MMKARKKHLWDGWYFDGERLICETGSSFNRKEFQDLLWNRIPQNEHWTGWHFYDDFLYDEAGNRYHVNDVRSVFMTRQLYHSISGFPHNVCSLKMQLEEKIKATKPPVIEVVYGDGTRRTLKY